MNGNNTLYTIGDSALYFGMILAVVLLLSSCGFPLDGMAYDPDQFIHTIGNPTYDGPTMIEVNEYTGKVRVGNNKYLLKEVEGTWTRWNNTVTTPNGTYQINTNGTATRGLWNWKN